MHKALETMKKGILLWSKYVSGVRKDVANTEKKHFEKLRLTVKVLKSPVETELAKLFETITELGRLFVSKRCIIFEGVLEQILMKLWICLEIYIDFGSVSFSIIQTLLADTV